VEWSLNSSVIVRDLIGDFKLSASLDNRDNDMRLAGDAATWVDKIRSYMIISLEMLASIASILLIRIPCALIDE